MSSNFASTITGYQFFQGLCWPDDPAAAAISPVMPRDEVQQKTAALQQILQTLMAADSGWPMAKPQTSEMLLPYVTDEVEELLEALQVQPDITPDGADAVAEQTASAPRPLAELSADWLWAIAASSPIAMQLLEGVAANVDGWSQVYGIRLVPTLEIESEDTTYNLDLTTQSWGSLVAAVAADASIQLLDLPLAPWVTASTLQTQLRDRSIALVPALRLWFAGIKVQLCLPNIPWMTAQARLVLSLVPLTLQVAEPEPAALEMPLAHTKATGLPTARVWQAEPPPATVVETSTAILDVPTLSLPWTLDSELSFLDAAVLAPARQARQQQELSQQVAAYGQSHPDLAPQTILEKVLKLPAEWEIWSLSLGQAPLSLLDLCNQVKWLWIQVGQAYMPLMRGLPVERLQSGEPWQSGTLMSQGQLVLLSDGQAIAALDVAKTEWITTATNLAATDLLHFSTMSPSDTAVWPVERLTQVLNQAVAARSPILNSLMAATPVKLWSPQDDLFPDVTPPALALYWQIVLTFSPSPS